MFDNMSGKFNESQWQQAWGKCHTSNNRNNCWIIEEAKHVATTEKYAHFQNTKVRSNAQVIEVASY